MARALRSALALSLSATRSLAARPDGLGVLPTTGVSQRRLPLRSGGERAWPVLGCLWRDSGAPHCGGSLTALVCYAAARCWCGGSRRHCATSCGAAAAAHARWLGWCFRLIILLGSPSEGVASR